jgi:hypothetical protein
VATTPGADGRAVAVENVLDVAGIHDVGERGTFVKVHLLDHEATPSVLVCKGIPAALDRKLADAAHLSR